MLLFIRYVCVQLVAHLPGPSQCRGQLSRVSLGVASPCSSAMNSGGFAQYQAVQSCLQMFNSEMQRDRQMNLEWQKGH